MISEIVNFVERINAKYFTEGLIPSDGLHIWIKLNDDGSLNQKKYYFVKSTKSKIEYFNEYMEKTDFPNEIVLMEFYSSIIAQNKGLDLPAKKIHSSSPYAIWFKKKSYNSLVSNLKGYFQNTKKFYEELHNPMIDTVSNFLKLNLISIVEQSNLIIKNLKDENYIKIYFDVDIKLLKNGYENYLGSNLFNKSDYNLSENELGLSGFLNGDNVKKLFLMHKTKHHNNKFHVNNHISKKEAFNLFLFEKLLLSKPNAKLPNPLPIFIDSEELLNEKMIALFDREGVKSFHEIIKKLYYEHKRDLGNYYLIFWTKFGGLTIQDIDFVPLFEFKLKDFYIHNYFLNDSSDRTIEDLFQFENDIVQKIFNNVLIQKSKDNKTSFKYFDEIEYNPQYMTKTNFINVLKYRKSFYDFIYKAKRNSIQAKSFYDLMISSIIDDIKHINNKTGYSASEYNTREKLNIFFSLNKNFGGIDMGSIIQPLQDKLKILLNEQTAHIGSDEEFAFDSGQLVYYLIYQSEAANKTHALMEPYISKNEPAQFKVALSRGIEQYKHKLPYGTKKFQKLASEVLGWETNTKIKDLLPIFLAGYFSNSLLFESSN